MCSTLIYCLIGITVSVDFWCGKVTRMLRRNIHRWYFSCSETSESSHQISEGCVKRMHYCLYVMITEYAVGCDKAISLIIVIIYIRYPPPISVPWPCDDPAPDSDPLISASGPSGWERGSTRGACWNSRGSKESHVAAGNTWTLLRKYDYCSHHLSMGYHILI